MLLQGYVLDELVHKAGVVESVVNWSLAIGEFISEATKFWLSRNWLVSSQRSEGRKISNGSPVLELDILKVSVTIIKTYYKLM